MWPIDQYRDPILYGPVAYGPLMATLRMFVYTVCMYVLTDSTMTNYKIILNYSKCVRVFPCDCKDADSLRF